MKLLKLKSGLYKKILGIFGAAGFLVTFQACYGTPQNYCNIEGSVLDKETNEGIQGLEVNVNSSSDTITAITDENGNFNAFLEAENDIDISIIDIDSEANGSFSEFDTTLTQGDHFLELKFTQE